MIISSYRQHIVLEASAELLERIAHSDFLNKYIPSVSVAGLDSGSHDGTKLRIKASSCTSLQQSGEVYDLLYNPESTTTEDVISVIDYIFDALRQDAEIYCVHASAAQKNGRTVLLIGGASGLGKTSVNLLLCRQFGFDFVGDEKVLVGKQGKILGSVPLIPDHKREVNLAAGHDDNETVSHIDLSKESVTAELIVQPVTAPSATLHMLRWGPQKAEWHLYEEMTRKIRGVSRRVNKFSYGLQSLDDPSKTQKRIENARKIANSVECLTIWGDAELVAQEIARQFDEQEPSTHNRGLNILETLPVKPKLIDY